MDLISLNMTIQIEWKQLIICINSKDVYMHMYTHAHVTDSRQFQESKKKKSCPSLSFQVTTA